MSTFAVRAQSSDPQPTSKVQPLSEAEKRLVLEQLHEDERLRKKIADYEAWIVQEQAQYARERATSQGELATANKAVTSCRDDLNLCQDKVTLYKNLYEAAIKKGGCGFFGGLWRILTLGSYRCK